MSRPILTAWLPGSPGLATLRRRLRDEVFSVGGSADLMAVRRAIIGPRAVTTEDIRTSSKNLNRWVPEIRLNGPMILRPSPYP